MTKTSPVSANLGASAVNTIGPALGILGLIAAVIGAPIVAALALNRRFQQRNPGKRPYRWGYYFSIQSFFGGIALLIGFLTRVIAVGFVFDMLVAILLVQLKRGFSGYELEFLLLVSSIALFLTGAGRFSVDTLLAGRDKPSEALIE